MIEQTEALSQVNLEIVLEGLHAEKFRTQSEIAQVLDWRMTTEAIATAVKALERQGRAERMPPNSAGVQMPAWRKVTANG